MTVQRIHATARFDVYGHSYEDLMMSAEKQAVAFFGDGSQFDVQMDVRPRGFGYERQYVGVATVTAVTIA